MAPMRSMPPGPSPDRIESPGTDDCVRLDRGGSAMDLTSHGFIGEAKQPTAAADTDPDPRHPKARAGVVKN
jgi:hypothetical protein